MSILRDDDFYEVIIGERSDKAGFLICDFFNTKFHGVVNVNHILTNIE